MLEAFIFIIALLSLIIGMYRRGIIWFIASIIAFYELYLLTDSVELIVLGMLLVVGGLLGAFERGRRR